MQDVKLQNKMLIIKNDVELCKTKMIEKYENNNHVELIDIQNLFDELYEYNICNSNNVKYYIFDNNNDIAMLIIVKNRNNGNKFNYYVVDDDFEIISCNQNEIIELLIELVE